MEPILQFNEGDDLIAQAHFFAVDAAQLNEAQAANTKATLAGIAAASQSFREAKAATAGDKNLTPSGKSVRLAEHTGKLAERLDATAETFRKLDSREVELTEAMSRTAHGTAPDSIGVMLEIEARALVRALDPLVSQTLYEQLARDGTDDATMRAIENAPAWGRIVRPEIIAQGRRARAARLDPDNANLLRQVRAQRSILGNSIEQARRDAGIVYDPILAMAGGKPRGATE